MDKYFETDKSWTWVSLKKICSIERGITFPRSAMKTSKSKDNFGMLTNFKYSGRY